MQQNGTNVSLKGCKSYKNQLTKFENNNEKLGWTGLNDKARYE